MTVQPSRVKFRVSDRDHALTRTQLTAQIFFLGTGKSLLTQYSCSSLASYGPGFKLVACQSWWWLPSHWLGSWPRASQGWASGWQR